MNSRFLRYAPYAALYFVQGAVTAYLQGFHKIYLESAGIPNAQIAALGAAFFLPFILKIFIAAGSDAVRHPFWGKRSTWIGLGIAIAAIGFAGAWKSPPGEQFALFAFFTVLISLGLATTDAVADGLAVETTPLKDEGFVQSLMFIGRAVGLIAFAPLMGSFVRSSGGYSVLFPLLLAALVPAALLLGQLPKATKAEKSARPPAKEIIGFFLRDEAPRFLAFSFLLSVLLYGSDGIFALHMKNTFELNPEAIGQFGTFRGVGAMIGAGVAGWMAARVRLGSMARFSGFALAIVLAGLALLSTGTAFLKLGVVWGFVSGFASTVFVAAAMRLSLGTWPATVFAVFMALANVGAAIGDAGATRLASVVGFKLTLLGLAALGFVAGPLAPKLRPADKPT